MTDLYYSNYKFENSRQKLKILMQIEQISFLNKKDQENKKTISKVQIKRQEFHKNRVIELKQRQRKASRLECLLIELYDNKILKQEEYPKEQNEIRNYIQKLLKQERLVQLTLLLDKLIIDKQDLLQHVFNDDYLKILVQFSVDRMHKPQIAVIFLLLINHHSRFYLPIIDKIQIIESITRQIKSIKRTKYQEIYSDVLEFLISHISKRHSQQMLYIFDVLEQLIQNQFLALQNGLKIVKSMSNFINQKRSFSFNFLQKIINCYEKQIQTFNGKPTQNMIDCIIFLIKIVFYQQPIDILLYRRMIKIFLHAKSNLPAFLVQDFHNLFHILYKLINNLGQHQRQYIMKSERNKCKIQFNEINPHFFNQLEKRNQKMILCSFIIEQMLSMNCHILGQKEFQQKYLAFILSCTKNCNKQIIVDYFVKSDFFWFLIDCIDHLNKQITGFALDIILSLLEEQVQISYILQLLKLNYQLQELLTQKSIAINSQNKAIQKRIDKILDIFDEYSMQN